MHLGGRRYASDVMLESNYILFILRQNVLAQKCLLFEDGLCTNMRHISVQARLVVPN